MRNAYMDLRSRGAASLKTENMSRKSSKLMFPLPSSLNTSQIRRLNGFSLVNRQVKQVHMLKLKFKTSIIYR